MLVLRDIPIRPNKTGTVKEADDRSVGDCSLVQYSKLQREVRPRVCRRNLRQSGFADPRGDDCLGLSGHQSVLREKILDPRNRDTKGVGSGYSLRKKVLQTAALPKSAKKMNTPIMFLHPAVAQYREPYAYIIYVTTIACLDTNAYYIVGFRGVFGAD